MSGAERNMNDTTMPPPAARSTSGSVKQSAPTSRRKTGRFGLADWNRLLQSSKDLAQRKGEGLRRIRWEEIKKHNSVYDGWIVLKGKVYFISPYLAYHPGGEAILKKIIGKDCSTLYDKYHRWVNEDGLIGKLHIGYLDTSPPDPEDEKRSYLPQQMTSDGFAIPAPKPKATATPMLQSAEAESEKDDAVGPWESSSS